MIDIHSHILPFIDDGATDWNEAIEMAQQAIADGITKIVATPHHANGRYNNTAPEINKYVVEFNTRIHDLNMNLEVLPGQEVRVYDNLLDDWKNGQLESLNHSKYLLLELPSSSVPSYVEEFIYELSLMGLQVIIAHPERNAEIANDPTILQNMIDNGALGQLTAQSLTGEFGKKLQKLSLDLCHKNLVQLIASDAHDTVRRPFGLSKAYQMIGHKLGSEIEQYFRDNAEKVIMDAPIALLSEDGHKSTRNKLSRLFSVFS
ncbi:tyrosine-protein phosphatase [Paenibacillus aceti]|uniref:Tyrosine-protein phosphatase n=1 Tax=Paenibacillus aceti TaxID=1820010 RepID=A0ABQ1VUI8_9BACL|nr:CpsB/CapC family capsule biosynthesis tyrosine phosphatase [Paenibacillus aceti]GGF96473.1 tyrosine protein phosphatase [Paenibacillus aceti]